MSLQMFDILWKIYLNSESVYKLQFLQNISDQYVSIMILFHIEYDYITLSLTNINNFPMISYVILTSTQKVERAVFWQLLFKQFFL